MYKEKFESVQCLRAFAAMAVVFLHAFGVTYAKGMGTILPEYAEVGHAGVDLFFVISGFIMVRLTDGSPGGVGAAWLFLKQRAQRIVPIYWLLTTVKIAAALAVPALFFEYRFDPIHAVKSFLFIPTLDIVGEMRPVIKVGWTLVFEAFFYAIFAGCLALFGRRARIAVVLVIACLVVIGQIHEFDSLVLRTWTDSIITNFLFGCLVGLAWPAIKMPPRLAGVFAVLSLCGFVASYFPDLYELPRCLKWGVPSLFLLVSVLSLEPLFRRPIFAPARLLGEASYSLYLVHTLVLGIVTVEFVKLVPKFSPLAYDLAILASSTALSVGISVGFHLVVERSISRGLRNWKRIPAAPQSQLASSRVA